MKVKEHSVEGPYILDTYPGWLFACKKEIKQNGNLVT